MITNNESTRGVHLMEKDQTLTRRIEIFENFIASHKLTYLRCIESPPDREVIVKDKYTGERLNMLMFGSNNYLGLGNHPHIKSCVKLAIDKFGCGIGGPPLLNGYTKLIEEAEERLAAMKSQESAMLFSSGFLTNLAIVSTLAQHGDIILYDEYSHASFFDGIKLTKAKALKFTHNNLDELESLLSQFSCQISGTLFVCVEGVYSMDGNIAPLKRITELCKKYKSFLIVDDAHGTGVLGEKGSGTSSFLHCSSDIDIAMGTFSKVFATCGGFLAGKKGTIDYLRYHARPYIFSASVPPPVVAAVLGGLDVLEQEPWLQMQLLENVKYAIEKLNTFEFFAKPEAAIIALKVPDTMDIRKAALLFHQKKIFINTVEYPAVAANKQRFRISFMATHTKEDIDKLAKTVEEVWNDKSVYL